MSPTAAQPVSWSMRVVTALLLILAVIPISPRANADVPLCNDACAGEHRMDGLFPFLEHITTLTPAAPVNSTTGTYDAATNLYWNTMTGNCGTPNFIFSSTAGAANAALRLFVKINDIQPYGSTGRYVVRLLVDGVQRCQYLRRGRGIVGPSTVNGGPQGDWFNLVIPNINTSTTTHTIIAQIAVVDPGVTMTVGQAFLTAQGVVGTYNGVTLPAASSSDSSVATITGAWSQISNTLHFTTAESVDMQVQAYFQVNSATAGHKLAVGFGLDALSSAHTIELGVPPSLPDGINVFDHITVPAGTHDLKLYAIDRDAGTATVQYRQIELIAFPSKNSALVTMPLIEAINTSTTLVGANNGAEQPWSADLRSAQLPDVNTYCGRWTNLLEMTVPAVATSGNNTFNMNGEVYLEVLGRQSGYTWKFPEVDLAVEAIYDPPPYWTANTAYLASASRVSPLPANQWYYTCIQSGTSGATPPNWPAGDTHTAEGATIMDGTVVWQAHRMAVNDFSFVSTSALTGDYDPAYPSVAPGRAQYFLFMDPMAWSVSRPNRVRLWVRKRNSDTACNSDPLDAGEFYIGKRYMSLKVIPTDLATCRYANPAQ
jgi:hypothetical protein